MVNEKIRTVAKKNKVRLWQIADRLGISEATITRKLRKEVPDSEKEKILLIISDIVNSNAETL